MQQFLGNLNPRLRHFLIHNCDCNNDNEILYALEAYGVVEPEDIDKYFGTSQINPDEEEIYVSLASQFDVKITRHSEETINVYYSEFSDKDVESLTFDISSRVESRVVVNTIKTTPYRINRTKRLDMVTKFRRLVLEADMRDASDVILSTVSVYGTMDVVPDVSCKIARQKKPLLSVKLTPKEVDQLIVASVKVLTKRMESDLDSLEGVETDINDPVSDGQLLLRLSATKARHGYKAAYRIHRELGLIKTLEQLNLSPEVVEVLKDMTKKRNGITLIAGAMGVGKTNTINAMIDLMVKQNLEISEISHPNENRLPVTQFNYQGNLERLEALISLSRKQALDAVMINEIQNRKVAKLSLDLVTSNVHVVTSVHLGRVYHLPHKLKSFLDDDYKDMIPLLNICYTQILVKELCPMCKTEQSLEAVPEKYRRVMNEFGYSKYHFYVEKGCDHCQNPFYAAKLRPFSEYLEFNLEITDKLMGINDAYEMQLMLRELMKERKTLLEYGLLRGISEGLIPLDSLTYIM